MKRKNNVVHRDPTQLFFPKVVVLFSYGRSSDLLQSVRLPIGLLADSGVSAQTLTELTAAGTVHDLHVIPF